MAYHHGITTRNKAELDLGIELKSDVVIGVLTLGAENNRIFSVTREKDPIKANLLYSKSSAGTKYDEAIKNPIRETDYILYSSETIEAIWQINPNAKLVVNEVYSPDYFFQQEANKNTKEEEKPKVYLNYLKSAANRFLKAELLVGLKPNILIAPLLDEFEVTKELVKIAEKLSAFVYADAVKPALYYAFDKILAKQTPKPNVKKSIFFDKLYFEGNKNFLNIDEKNFYNANHQFLNSVDVEGEGLSYILDYVNQFKEDKYISFTFGSKLLIKSTRYNNQTDTWSKNGKFNIPMVAALAAMRSYVDATQGWHKSVSNVEIPKEFEIEKQIYNIPINLVMSLEEASKNTDVADILNKKGVILLDSKNKKFWGNRTAWQKNNKYIFEVAVRTEFILIGLIAKGLAWSVDKGMSAGTITDIIEIIQKALDDLTREGKLLGGNAFFDKKMNPAKDIEEGKIKIDYDFTPIPPLEQLGLSGMITGRYIHNLLDAIK